MDRRASRTTVLVMLCSRAPLTLALGSCLGLARALAPRPAPQPQAEVAQARAELGIEASGAARFDVSPQR